MRLAYAHVVVLDGLFGEAERAALLDQLIAPGWNETQARQPFWPHAPLHEKTTTLPVPPSRRRAVQLDKQRQVPPPCLFGLEPFFVP